MVTLKIFNLDDVGDANVIASLTNGTHVIGRGDLLNVKDKRVSRKHAIIDISEDNITLTSAHVNPCFFQAAQGRNLTIITKDNTNDLGDGDRFGLLPDSLWFRVKIGREPEENHSVHDDFEITNIERHNITEVLEDGNNSADITAGEVADENKIENNNTNIRINLTSTEENGSGFKRHINENKNECEDPSKKPRLIDNEASTSLNNIQSEAKTNEFVTSQLSECESLNLQIEEDAQDINYTEVTSHTNEELNNSANLGSDGDTSAPINDTDNVNIDVRIQVDQIKQEELTIKTSQGSNTSQNAVPIKTEPNGEQGIKQEPSEENDHAGQSGVNAQLGNGTDHTDINVAAGQSSTTKKLRRERCWYADRCFRKNPHHRETFSHPGDQDYNSDAQDDRPECPYGAACYRRNIEHRQEYKHANRPAPKPKTPQKQRRQTDTKSDSEHTSDDDTNAQADDTNPSQDTQEMKKRRRKKAAKRATLKESPLDDYDYEDPFICDSSDEFQFDEDDDDTDDSD